VDSVIPLRERESVMRSWNEYSNITTRRLRTELEGNFRRLQDTGIDPKALPKNIWIHSLLMRERIIRILSSYSGINICGHKFPLPPVINDMRLMKLKTWDLVLNELVQAVNVESAERGDIIQNLNSLEGDFRNKLDELAIKSHELLIKRGIHKTQCNYKYGDELIHFSRYKDETLHVPISIYELKNKTWNCKLENILYKPSTKILKYEVVPNLINIWKKDLETEDEHHPTKSRWHSIVWAEFSGENAYHDEINTLTREEATIRSDLTKLKDELEQNKIMRSGIDEKLGKHTDRLKEINDMYEILKHDVFDLHQVMDVVGLIKDEK